MGQIRNIDNAYEWHLRDSSPSMWANSHFPARIYGIMASSILEFSIRELNNMPALHLHYL